MQLLVLLGKVGEAGVSQAAAELDVAPSTASRLLATMADYGFVERSHGRRYRLGPAVSSAASDPTSRLVATLGPVLRRLHDTVAETVHLMVLVGGDTIFIDGVESRHALRVGLRIGARMPAYCSSGGKAILAGLGRSELADIYPWGLPSWPTQRLWSIEELERELSEVRAAGVAYNRGESEVGVHALGVALRDSRGRPVAGIAVAVPEARFASGDTGRITAALHQARFGGERLLGS